MVGLVGGHRQEAVAAVRRHEAARGHRARLRDPAAHAAARRALRRARRADARHHPGRAAAHLRRDAPDGVHDHARRRRGDPAGRPHPADEQRPAGARGRDRAQHDAARPHARHAAPRPAVLPHPQPPGRLPGGAQRRAVARPRAGAAARGEPGPRRPEPDAGRTAAGSHPIIRSGESHEPSRRHREDRRHQGGQGPQVGRRRRAGRPEQGVGHRRLPGPDDARPTSRPAWWPRSSA